jgi:hypothetical protein
MKKAFLFGLIAGFGGILAAAHFYPWVDPLRIPSHSSVVANGGRAERFLIRLPADEIASFATPGAGLPGGSGAARPLPQSGAPAVLGEFKLRDVDGKVVGLAARHWTTTQGGGTTAWTLMLPGRGTLVLAGAGGSPAALDDALRRHGYRPGAAWHGHATLRAGTGGTPANAAGGEEFAGLDVRYTETWSLTGVAADGALRGTIALDTTSRRGER